MSEIKVNSIKGVGASAAAITVNNTDGTCTANITNNLSNRNLIINGAMQVAQRGTSSNSSGYQTVDRIATVYSGLDNAPTFEQVDTSSSDTPYTLGLRKAFKVTNGDQTSVGAADNFRLEYKVEAQDIAQSGWNIKSATSFITLSFWVKSSVAQNFAIRLFNQDGNYAYSFVFAATTSWTKITHSIKGDSGIVINNDTGGGLNINWVLFDGTDFTTPGHTNETWATYSGTSKVGDMTNTWYDTNDATFELTGVQLEVGSVATDFEHRSFGQELYLCQRYFELLIWDGYGFYGYQPNANAVEFQIRWNVEKRANPSITLPATGTGSGQIGPTNTAGSNMTGGSLDGPFSIKKTTARITGGSWSGGASGAPCALYSGGSPGAIIQISAEL